MKKVLYLPVILLLALSCTESNPAGSYLAKVNDVAITKEDIIEEFNMLPVQIQELFKEKGGMESLVDEIIKKELLYQEAKKKGFASNAVFRKRLEDFKRRLMIEFLLEEEIEKKAQVSDKEIRDFYKTNKDDFLIEVPGKRKKESVEFDRVKGLIQQRLIAEKQKDLFDSYIASLKKTVTVELDREAIKRAFGNRTTE